ncbi:MAG: nitrile hydratase subunit beta [Pseudomonadales bacterium]|nr:nitrile hydratase subunit beta [Pseudomonadales bacterium]MBO6597699.1 nitrile hydratase subunit beta [Pseudomonadales bacterium]MBO6704014.1 nitrile hydratase subunit beta [Pseudomonadales bacterium]MBO6823937.1 nitrile hydratase subunit beta [Pseudomonadales bacterium]MBO7007791.1 nitrile hydratase subunit beta [Pseudomonadales bacterium]
MDGVHDLGGKPGFGKVDKTGEDEVFHERWEGAVFTMVGAGSVAGAWYHSDQFRHAVERIAPEAYLTHGYYGRWLGGLETLLVEAGIVSRDELEKKVAEMGGADTDLVAANPSDDPDPLGEKPAKPGARRSVKTQPLFSVGDRVRTSKDSVPGHTRLPAYARDKVGEVISCHGGWVYPDTAAHGRGEDPQHLFTVRFTSEALWNKAGFSVSLDLFEPYLALEESDV